MRLTHAALHLLPTTLLITLTTAFQFPNLQPFLSALPLSLSDYFPPAIDNATQHDLLRRSEAQNRQSLNSDSCPAGFNACSNLGAPQLCCASAAVCSADAAGNVACCPSGAACSGTISGVISSGTVNAQGSLVNEATATGGAAGGGGGAVVTSSSGAVLFGSSSIPGLVPATTQANSGASGFVIDGSSTVATPGAGMRRAEIPIVAKVVVRALEYLII